MLSHQPHYISVYSNSWGPSDSGFVVGGPGKYTLTVLQQGATEVYTAINVQYTVLLTCLLARDVEVWATSTHLQVVMVVQMVTHVQLMAM